ncbi:MAG TPA: ATP-dependent Clp protease adaptor ClpS, partial [Fimbriimonas sp.]
VRMVQTEINPETIDGSSQGNGRWMVLIYNNDFTTMDEVIEALMVATGCGVEEAFCEMWEAHTYGKAPCHFASHEECESVAGVIQRAGIDTSVCQEWDD